MKTFAGLTWLLAALLLCGCATPWSKPRAKRRPAPAALLVATARDAQLRADGRWYLQGADQPFTGRLEEYFANGKKATELHLQEGLGEGPYLLWHEDGQKQLEASYRLGRLEGMAREWYLNGQIKSQSTFRNGTKISHKEWFANGLQKEALDWNPDGAPKAAVPGARAVEYEQIEFRDSQGRIVQDGFTEGTLIFFKGETTPFSGQVISRYSDGRKREEVTVAAGRPDGLWTEWHPNGQRQLEFDYRQGRLLRYRLWNADGQLIDTGQGKPPKTLP